MPQLPPLLQIDNIILSIDLLTEKFCCDLSQCHGACCIEGDAGAPLELEEVALCEEMLPLAEKKMTAAARELVLREGVATVDPEGELVTQTVGGRDCVFAFREGACHFCALENIARQTKAQWKKPVSCHLYPIRVKQFAGGLIGLNYHRWNICESARRLGREQNVPVYRFLRAPLINRFGREWYKQLEEAARQLGL